MGDAAAQVLAAGADGLEGIEQREHQVVAIAGPSVGEFLLGQLPDAFVGVELRGICREAFQAQPLGSATEILDQSASVGAATVPEDDHVAAQVLEQMAQEIAGLCLLDVLLVELKVEVQAPAFGGDRNARDRRDPVTTVEVAQDRRLANGSPALGNGGGQQEARFVGENEVGTQPRSVFFTLGQSSRMKRRILASSRSSAFFCAFWWLHPKPCRSRPTWSRWYRTRNFLRITSATRAVVHNCVGYPFAIAPFSSTWTSEAAREAESFLGRPGEKRTFSPLDPPRRLASRHRITELGAQPIRRPTSLRDKPSSSRANARRRRSSSRSADPRGRIPHTPEARV